MQTKITNRFLIEERYRKEAIEASEMMSTDEAKAWLKHPCTLALTNAIQADMCGIIDAWLGASYTNPESADASVMQDNKARGMAHAMEDILETIDKIGRKNFLDYEGEDK